MHTPEKSICEPYFGQDPLIEKVKMEINMAVNTACTLLLLGETGAGKGVLARWIHNRSPRKDMAFVDVNCSGLRGELLKSELFGHTKGSFTGAINDRSGILEEANGGTLFLDEIGDMDIETQCLLLKIIEDKLYRRIGENKARLSDFRLICATNRDLQEAMCLGAFRRDLFYRISVFSITLPPLRERKSDIAGLLNHILQNRNYPHFPLCRNLVDALTRYPWPGNIREVCNAIDRALLFAQGKALAMEHFTNLKTPRPLFPEPIKIIEAPADLIKPPETFWDLDNTMERHIIRALEYFNGDKAKTSRALGISLSCLYRKLKQFSNK